MHFYCEIPVVVRNREGKLK